MADTSVFKIVFLERDFAIGDLTNKSWERAETRAIDNYWSGKPAPVGRAFEARVLWSETALYVRFDANREEPLVISDDPVLDQKTLGLWERDVCEIFIAPDISDPCKYFEFEAAPTGEWLDLSVDMSGDERVTNIEYDSGMQAVARIDEKSILIAMCIPWEAFGKKPSVGNVWLGNIFRCVGKEPDRGYLAWRPTITEIPNFHVPSAFGKFEFAGRPA